MGIARDPIGSNGAMIIRDQKKPWKIYGAEGEGARSWRLRAGLPCDDTTAVPTEFISTVVGTSPTTAGVVAGYPLLLTTGGTEYNGINLQLRGALASVAAGKQTFLRGKILMSEEKTSDFLFGLCVVKTDLLKTSTAHGVLATNVEGIFFHKVAGAEVTTINLKVYKDGTEISSVAVGTMVKTAAMDFALWVDGTKIHAYIDDVEVATLTGTVPDSMLTPSINVRAGAAAAVTASVAELAFVAIE